MMALLSTPICNFGEKIKEFELINIDEKIVKSKSIKGINGTLIMFICNHCPYVKAIIKDLVITAEELNNYGINSVAIMPNDTEKYPEDDFDNMKKFSSSNGFKFPYLFDEKQEIAKKFGAVCTPDFFGYNKSLKLQYRGRFDASGMSPAKKDIKHDLLEAMLQVAKTSKGPVEQIPSMGCSIKWKI